MQQFRYTFSVLSLILICAATYAQDYEIYLTLDGPQASTGSPGTGAEPGTYYGGTYYDATAKILYISFTFTSLITPATAAHIHGPAGVGASAGVLIPFSPFPASTSGGYIASYVLDATKEGYLFGAMLYVNIHTSSFPAGEIRGQLLPGGAFPVELVSFNAIAKGRGVELAWKTATETNNHGFEIERRVASDRHLEGDGHLAWQKIGFVEGNGTVNTPKEYSFIDNTISSGTYSYRLKQIDRDGQFEYHKAVEVVMSQIPLKHSLMQNFPNPFNPSTAITYSVPNAGKVSLSVYDMLGKEVASLVNGIVEAGEHTAQFNASQLPSGMYFYTIRTNNFTETKRMLLVK